MQWLVHTFLLSYREFQAGYLKELSRIVLHLKWTQVLRYRHRHVTCTPSFIFLPSLVLSLSPLITSHLCHVLPPCCKQSHIVPPSTLFLVEQFICQVKHSKPNESSAGSATSLQLQAIPPVSSCILSSQPHTGFVQILPFLLCALLLFIYFFTG